MLKRKVQDLIFTSARRTAWRTGRWLSSVAHGHSSNAMETNGEAALQRAVLARAAKAGRAAVVCDVGANLGDWSEMCLTQAAELGGTAQVFAFEPIPATAEKFIARFQGRKDDAPSLQRMALSDSAGSAEMAVFSETGGTNSLVFRDAPEVAERVSVPLQTFDAWATGQGLEAVDLVKIDAEGHDLAVMRGAVDSLAQGRIGVMQFEYNHRWIASRVVLADAFDLAEAHGYALGQLLPSGLEVYESWHFELEDYVEANYALIHPATLPDLPHTKGRFDASNIFVADS